MATTVLAGAVLGVLVTLWTLVVVYSGWYLNPGMIWTFWFVVVIETGVLIWALRRTAAAGQRYWGQVSTGFLASVIGGILIFAGSLLVTMVLVPEYFTDIRAMGAELARQAGQSEAEVQRILETPTQTPVQGAFAGFMGTVVTGLVVSLVAALFIRSRK